MSKQSQELKESILSSVERTVMSSRTITPVPSGNSMESLSLNEEQESEADSLASDDLLERTEKKVETLEKQLKKETQEKLKYKFFFYKA